MSVKEGLGSHPQRSAAGGAAFLEGPGTRGAEKAIGQVLILYCARGSTNDASRLWLSLYLVLGIHDDFCIRHREAKVESQRR